MAQTPDRIGEVPSAAERAIQNDTQETVRPQSRDGSQLASADSGPVKGQEAHDCNPAPVNVVAPAVLRFTIAPETDTSCSGKATCDPLSTISARDIMSDSNLSSIKATRSAFDVGGVVRASDSISAMGRIAREQIETTEHLGKIIRATDSLHAFSVPAFDWPKATDVISALSTSIVASTAMRESLAVGMRAADFLTREAKLSNVLTNAMSLAQPLSAFSAARTGLDLASTAIASLSAVAKIERRYFEETASIISMARERHGIFSAAQRLTAPYLGAAACMVALEARFTEISAAALPRVSSDLLSGASVSALRDHLSVLSVAASTTWKNYDTVIAMPQSTAVLDWLRRPATELYNATQVVAAISLEPDAEVERDEEIEAGIDEMNDAFEARLRRLNPELVHLYRGGVEALERGGTDWQRHTTVSFRELLTHVLHKLAPDDEVKKIATQDEIVRDKPTRIVRLRYIYGTVANGAVTDFFAADVKAAIKLFDFLNDGTHRLGVCATPPQLRFIKSRLVGLVSSMLEARGY